MATPSQSPLGCLESTHRLNGHLLTAWHTQVATSFSLSKTKMEFVLNNWEVKPQWNNPFKIFLTTPNGGITGCNVYFTKSQREFWGHTNGPLLPFTCLTTGHLQT